MRNQTNGRVPSGGQRKKLKRVEIKKIRPRARAPTRRLRLLELLKTLAEQLEPVLWLGRSNMVSQEVDGFRVRYYGTSGG